MAEHRDPAVIESDFRQAIADANNAEVAFQSQIARVKLLLGEHAEASAKRRDDLASLVRWP